MCANSKRSSVKGRNSNKGTEDCSSYTCFRHHSSHGSTRWVRFWKNPKWRNTPSRAGHRREFDLRCRRCKDGAWKWRTHIRPSAPFRDFLLGAFLAFTTAMREQASVRGVLPTFSRLFSSISLLLKVRMTYMCMFFIYFIYFTRMSHPGIDPASPGLMA